MSFSSIDPCWSVDAMDGCLAALDDRHEQVCDVVSMIQSVAQSLFLLIILIGEALSKMIQEYEEFEAFTIHNFSALLHAYARVVHEVLYDLARARACCSFFTENSIEDQSVTSLHGVGGTSCIELEACGDSLGSPSPSWTGIGSVCLGTNLRSQNTFFGCFGPTQHFLQTLSRRLWILSRTPRHCSSVWTAR